MLKIQSGRNSVKRAPANGVGICLGLLPELLVHVSNGKTPFLSLFGYKRPFGREYLCDADTPPLTPHQVYKQTWRELLKEVPCPQLALIAVKLQGKCMGFWYANQRTKEVIQG